MKFNRRLLILVVVIIACLMLLGSKITFNFTPEYEGFFILKGEKGCLLEISDDLVPEDTQRLIWAMPRYPFKSIVTSAKCDIPSHPCIDFKWNKKYGRGFVRNSWPDGTKLIINLGRFKGSNGKYPAGLFIGGGLPPSDPDYQFMNNEATGMTFFDGRRWYHVWCNANEGLVSPVDLSVISYPSDWALKDSRVLENDSRHLTIQTEHHTLFTGVPLGIRRTLFYTAGTRYAILSTELTNQGSLPLPFMYMYGDEPWVGDYGSSAGDVGWFEDKLILTEQYIDTQLYTYIGIFDYGNDLAGENHVFTGIANFIEWNIQKRPTYSYISNSGEGIISPGPSTPLNSPANRFVGLLYGPYMLMPGESYNFTIAVGMAEKDPKTGFPVKPHTGLNP